MPPVQRSSKDRTSASSPQITSYEHYITPEDGASVPDIWAFQPYTGGTLFGREAAPWWTASRRPLSGRASNAGASSRSASQGARTRKLQGCVRPKVCIELLTVGDLPHARGELRTPDLTRFSRSAARSFFDLPMLLPGGRASARRQHACSRACETAKPAPCQCAAQLGENRQIGAQPSTLQPTPRRGQAPPTDASFLSVRLIARWPRGFPRSSGARDD